VTKTSLADLRNRLYEAYASQHAGSGSGEAAALVYRRDIRSHPMTAFLPLFVDRDQESWLTTAQTSARKLATASADGANRQSLTRSVTTRLIFSGIDRSRLRRPASTCASGIPGFAAASARAGFGPEQIHLVGNVMVDTLLPNAGRAAAR